MRSYVHDGYEIFHQGIYVLKRVIWSRRELEIKRERICDIRYADEILKLRIFIIHIQSKRFDLQGVKRFVLPVE